MWASKDSSLFLFKRLSYFFEPQGKHYQMRKSAIYQSLPNTYEPIL